MTAVLLGHEVHDSPEWHALRTKGLGGSEIAAVVGLSPWVSRFALYHRKRGDLPEQTANQSMSWGTRLEPVVLDAYAERYPNRAVLRSPGTWHHAERRWQIANVDAFSDGIPVDAKTADKYDAWKSVREMGGMTAKLRDA